MSTLTTLGKDLLLLLFWSLDKASRPTFWNLTESFEGWEHRRRLQGQVRYLEKQQLVVREHVGDKIVHRLTESGRLAAMGGRDPVTRWNRPWDGFWRMLLFDLPVGQSRARVHLWRWLRTNHFGYLQQSVWITPDPVDELAADLADFREDVESCLVMDSRCAAGYANPSVVHGAWDFVAINQRYDAYVAQLHARPSLKAMSSRTEGKLIGWLREERLNWEAAISWDPLLPRVLWPANYAGERAWHLRLESLAELAHQWKRVKAKV